MALVPCGFLEGEDAEDQPDDCGDAADAQDSQDEREEAFVGLLRRCPTRTTPLNLYHDLRSRYDAVVQARANEPTRNMDLNWFNQS